MYICLYIYLHVYPSLIFDCDPFFNGTDNTHQIKCIASICSSKELLQWIDTYNIKINNPEIASYLLGKDAVGKDAMSEDEMNEGVTSGGVSSTGAASGGGMNGGVASKGTTLPGVAMRSRAGRGSHHKDLLSGSKSRQSAYRGGISTHVTVSEGISIEDVSDEDIFSGVTSGGGAPNGGVPTGGTKWHAFRTALNEHLCGDDAIDLVGKMLRIDHQVTPLVTATLYIPLCILLK